jgi:Tfp pilus tip-associated adhesin PilY1
VEPTAPTPGRIRRPTDSDGGAAYQSRVDDLWHAAINGRGKYFSASDPTEVVDGLGKALSAIQTRNGAASAAATSTPNITTLDNDVFSSTFTTVKWFGELSDRKISAADGTSARTRCGRPRPRSDNASPAPATRAPSGCSTPATPA